MYNQCVDIGEYDKLSAFVAVIKEIEEPYNNEDIQKAKEAYENVPSGLQSFVSAEIQAKYEAILACILVLNTKGQTGFRLSAFLYREEDFIKQK